MSDKLYDYYMHYLIGEKSSLEKIKQKNITEDFWVNSTDLENFKSSYLCATFYYIFIDYAHCGKIISLDDIFGEIGKCLIKYDKNLYGEYLEILYRIETEMNPDHVLIYMTRTEKNK